MLSIDHIYCPERIEDKLFSKHSMSMLEVRQVLLSQPRIRFAETGDTPGEDVYAAFGQSFGGRYLVIFFVFKSSEHTAIVISGRDMTTNERKRYAKK